MTADRNRNASSLQPRSNRKARSSPLKAGGQDFLRILDHAQIGIVVCSLEGKYLRVNEEFCHMAGFQKSQLLRKTIHDVSHPEDYAHEIKLHEQLLAGEIASYKIEKRLIRKDLDLVWIQVVRCCVRDSSGQVLHTVGIVQDITERRRTEAALRQSEERMRYAFEIETVGIIFFEPDGLITQANKAFMRMSGYDQEDLEKGHIRWDLMTPEEYMPVSHKALHELLSTGRTTPYEKQYIRKDGRRWWGLFAAKLINEAEGVEFILNITDRRLFQETLEQLNTQLESLIQARTAELQAANQELRHSYERLQILSQRLVEVQEDERRAIARELHDRVGQSLIALKLNMEVIGAQLGSQTIEPVNKRLLDSKELLSQLVLTVRSVMADLRPPVLDEYGLTAALETTLDEFRFRYGMNVRLEKPDSPLPPIAQTLEITILRITQESLFNIMKYASASETTVSLWQEERQIYLTIQDNGIGFEPLQSLRRRATSGLRIMRERAEAIGGNLTIESAPGRGTKIKTVLPMETISLSKS